jgi:hypothetical protein
MNANRIKAEVLAYLRYQLRLPFVSVEHAGADLFALDEARRGIEVEIKCTVSDLKRDRHKPKHNTFAQLLAGKELEPLYRIFTPTRFYFAVPEALEDRAHPLILETYPWAGLLIVGPSKNMMGHQTLCLVKAPRLHGDRLPLRQVVNEVKNQTAAMAHAYAMIVKLEEKLLELTRGKSILAGNETRTRKAKSQRHDARGNSSSPGIGPQVNDGRPRYAGSIIGARTETK